MLGGPSPNHVIEGETSFFDDISTDLFLGIGFD